MQTLYIYFCLLVALTFSMTACTSTSPPNPTLTPTPTQTLTPYPSTTPTPLVVLETIEGSFRNQIRILERNMPRGGSEGYVRPSKEERADFSKLVSMINSDQLADMMQLADANHYTLNYYVDRGDDEAVSYLLREKRPIEMGWGLYAIRLDSTSNIIVEAPHPLYDRRTPSIALDIYRALDARALLIAGAHRNTNHDGSADVAHETNSIFHAVHETLSKDLGATSGDVIILQIHGFHTSKHEGYPPVVIGLGKNAQTNEITLAQKIKDALSEQEIDAGICTGTESDFQDLCATTNVQGSATEEGAFIHIELSEKLRKDDKAFITALVQVFGQ